MTAGPNCIFSVWRWTYETDDSVGGAAPTGTYVYNTQRGRMQEEMTDMMFFQQGLEVPKVYHMVVQPVRTIYERDEIEVIAPNDSPWFGERFRVVDVTMSSFTARDPRNYMMLTLTRSERAHGSQ